MNLSFKTTCCKILILSALIFMACPPISARQDTLDSLLQQLDDALDRRDTYFVLQEYKIDSLRNVLHKVPAGDYSARARAYHDVFKAFESMQGDSALNYANLEYEAAKLSGLPDDILRAKSDLIFTHLSSGNFTECVDIVNKIDLKDASPKLKTEFYYLCIRVFSDLSNYLVSDFNDKNARLSGAYCDSVMQIADPGSYEYQYALAFSPMKNLPPTQKISIFEKLLKRPDIQLGTKAMLASILGDFYRAAGDENEFAANKIRSAILDIQSAKRETISKLDIGKWLFERGDIDRAHRYIDAAKEDADFYNARNRKFQIMGILPLVEKARYLDMNKKRDNWLMSTMLACLIVVALCFVAFFIVRQLKATRKAKKAVEESNTRIQQQNTEIKRQNVEIQQQNDQIQQKNDEIQKKNDELNEMLDKLRESNKIKDEYIGYAFYVHAEYIRKLESLYNMVDRKLMARQYDDLRKSLKQGDIRREKENMHDEFDRVFLRLFPDFVKRYKALFPADDAKNAESNGHTLTSEMRIFALIRLGITDISDIALFLNYSVNTVNTYKTKAKNRSLLANEDFEPEIMKIKST